MLSMVWSAASGHLLNAVLPPPPPLVTLMPAAQPTHGQGRKGKLKGVEGKQKGKINVKMINLLRTAFVNAFRK